MILHLTLAKELDFSVALRYLGVKGACDGSLEALLERAARVLREKASPKAAYLTSDIGLLDGCLEGGDIKKHLEGCHTCVLLACTLGAGVDLAQRAANASDMAFAVVLDALASVMAEQAADEAEGIVRGQLAGKGLFLTSRFSPGYGDYPISAQNRLLDILDAPRGIGLCATPTHLMTPRKSITAVLGVSDRPVTGRRAGCAHCALRDRCLFRKEGKTCE